MVVLRNAVVITIHYLYALARSRHNEHNRVFLYPGYIIYIFHRYIISYYHMMQVPFEYLMYFRVLILSDRFSVQTLGCRKSNLICIVLNLRQILSRMYKIFLVIKTKKKLKQHTQRSGTQYICYFKICVQLENATSRKHMGNYKHFVSLSA